MACKKPNQFPPEPSISFKDIYTVQSTTGFDQNIIVLLDFTDGDGDVGLRSPGNNDSIFDNPDSTNLYFNDYIVKIAEMKNGQWFTGHPWDTVNLSGRIPYLTPDLSYKSLKGEIKRELPVPPALVNDTLRFEIYIIDRSLHKSNIITTPYVILNTQ